MPGGFTEIRVVLRPECCGGGLRGSRRNKRNDTPHIVHTRPVQRKYRTARRPAVRLLRRSAVPFARKRKYLTCAETTRAPFRCDDRMPDSSSDASSRGRLGLGGFLAAGSDVAALPFAG
eukprot:3938023-Prymnesium_polylepis.1